MINREWQTVQLLTYSGNPDEYGQLKTDTPTETPIQMVVHILTQSEVQNPLYNKVELVGLTKHKNISDANRVLIDGTIYSILHVLPSQRYLQVFMGKNK